MFTPRRATPLYLTHSMAPSLNQHTAHIAPSGRVKVNYDTWPYRREYDHRVDFIPFSFKETLRGTISCLVPMSYQSQFVNGLLDAHVTRYFRMAAHKVDYCKDPEQMWYQFRIRPTFLAGEATQALRILLSEISKRPEALIIWKEDDHGYEINKFGDILRKWKLEPF